MRTALLFSALIVLLTGANIQARLLESWPYEKLFKEADLIVIAVAVESKDCEDKTSDNVWKIELLGVNTSFKVLSVLKGKPEKEPITVLHFKLANGVDIPNGPCLVRFRTKPLDLEAGATKIVGLPAPECLLFLKKRKDGRYEPVSGRIDPELSIREIYRSFTSR